MLTLEEALAAHNQRQFQDMLAEFSRVSEWCERTFPSVEWRVEFNSQPDKLAIKMRLLTRKDLDPSGQDQLLKKKNFVVTPQTWGDTVIMYKWIGNLYKVLTKSITHEVNKYYQLKKEQHAV